MGCHNLLGRYGKVFVMEDQFLDYVTVFATAVVCFVISLCFGWDLLAALLFGIVTGAVQAGLIRLVHGRPDLL